MKTLKFASELVPLILSGSKTSTWRLFDDKDLQVGDTLKFQISGSLENFANAEISHITEKPLGMLTEEDEDGHEAFPSKEVMYETYTRYYNRDVSQQTPVKIIRFKLLDS